MVLTSKARQFLLLGACRPVNALAGVPLGLLHPSGNRLCGRLELTRQLFGRASTSHQISHLSPELRRISGSVTGHQTPQKSTSKVSTKPGQIQTAVFVWDAASRVSRIGACLRAERVGGRKPNPKCAPPRVRPRSSRQARGPPPLPPQLHPRL